MRLPVGNDVDDRSQTAVWIVARWHQEFCTLSPCENTPYGYTDRDGSECFPPRGERVILVLGILVCERKMIFHLDDLFFAFARGLSVRDANMIQNLQARVGGAIHSSIPLPHVGYWRVWGDYSDLFMKRTKKNYGALNSHRSARLSLCCARSEHDADLNDARQTWNLSPIRKRDWDRTAGHGTYVKRLSRRWQCRALGYRWQNVNGGLAGQQ